MVFAVTVVLLLVFEISLTGQREVARSTEVTLPLLLELVVEL